MSIITDAPGWLVVLCLLAGIVYAGALYFRDRFNQTYGYKLAAFLGILRFICVSILALFLLKPLIRIISREVEKPVIVIAQDNSESLLVGKDSSYYKSEYLRQLNELTQAFGDEYEIRTYRFGQYFSEGINEVDYSEKMTDFNVLLDEITSRYSGRNLGAIILASDGLYNKGSNPVYSYQKLNVPVYTIALGDTTVHRDLLIPDVAVNRLAYLGNKFPMEITVEGRKSAGAGTELEVIRKGQVVYREALSVEGDRWFKKIPITFDATETGLQKYSIQIKAIDNEISLANNRKDVFIDVLDSRQKVLILAYAPHPDINALRDAIASNESYKADVALAKDFNGNFSEYSLIILHQLPSATGEGNNIVSNIVASNTPALFVWGSSTGFSAFNELNTGYSLSSYRNNSTDIAGSYADDFTYFTINQNVSSLIRTLPPLSVPFGDYAFSPGVSALIYQQVGQIKTKKPLISFNKDGEKKIGLIAGEGIWRWRINAFQQTESHDAFNELITKTVQFLASKEDKSLFRVEGKNDFAENEHVTFKAEVYNQSYEALTNKEVSMRITGEDGKEYSYTFSPDAGFYKLDAGLLPVGNYKYEARVEGDVQLAAERGEFSVSPLQMEIMHTIADHRLLNQFAVENGGRMVYPQEMMSLADLIKNKKEIVSVSYENKELNELINYRWILGLIILLLAGEWLLRKRAGTY